MSGFNALQAQAYDAAARQRQRQQFQGMSAYDRHKKMVRDLAVYYGRHLGGEGCEGDGSEEGGAPMKTDYDVLKEAYRFIRTEEDDAADSWEVRLARRYYSKLYREFCIADLSRHAQGRVGLRWRTQREVVAGKGQFICGAVGCDERRGLASFEVPFAYQEAGERKQALVKVRVCPTHAYQLNYRKHKEAEEAHKKREQKEAKRAKRRKHRRRSDSGTSDSDEDAERSKRSRKQSGRSSGSEHNSDGSREGGAAGGGCEGEQVAAAAASGKPEAGSREQVGGAVGQHSKAGAQVGEEFEEFFQGLFE